MIKANELRIGNYVMYNQTTHIITNVGLDMSSSVWIGIWKNVLEDIFVHDNKFLKPIPLTEQWLLLFGFDNMVVCWRIIYNELGNIITINQLKDKFYLNYLDREIKYVHQLQNLYFALTNEELKLK